MAPLPENNTGRAWVDYSDGINPHSLMVRYDAVTSDPASALARAALFLSALSPQMYAISITGARASDEGSTFSFPVTWPGSSSYGTGTMPGSVAPRQLCYLGRSLGGRRVRWFVFGCLLETPNDYQFALSENTDLAEAWGVISDSFGGGVFLCIDGQAPVLYNYIDVNFNSYWETEQRP